MRQIALACGVVVAFALPGCAPTSGAKKSPSEIIPLTAANLRGHESLYREGWFIVTSTQRAFSYAKEHSIDSSAGAMRQTQRFSSAALR
jgi:hypothetical protein